MENKLRRSFKFIRTRPCEPTVHNIPFEEEEEEEEDEERKKHAKNSVLVSKRQ